MAGIFKPYNIRGIYGESITMETAIQVGRAFGVFLRPIKGVAGRDIRSHSRPLFEPDGLSIEFDTWWFNVRPSNNEPLCRLNLEARSLDEMPARRDEVLTLIRS